MLFHSVEFILGFLPICFIIFAIVHRTAGKRAALAWLALASIIFYAQWSLAHGALLVGSVGTNYLFSRAMLRTDQQPKLRQAIFILAIAANLALLGYLKYTNFLIDNINALTEANYHYVAVLAPVGISFFTFIQIGFLVEVYNRQVSRLSIVDYFLFGSFFGYVTAGPLVLQRDMTSQFERKDDKVLDLSRISIAITVFGFGLFKKMVLADSVAPYADAVFNGVADGALPSTSLAWIGALAYTVQLYFDFSGYSDMALGAGLLFGLKLPFNFNSPLKATSITDFWRRWHMTMTRFFTNYLYSPLAVAATRRAMANKSSKAQRFVASVAVPVFFTFLLAGIWHGAGWTFVIFGAIHGLAMAINHAWRQSKAPTLPAPAGWLLTMSVVITGLVFFRAPDVSTALVILTAMVGAGADASGWVATVNVPTVSYPDAVAVITLLAAIALMMPNTQQILYRHKISSDPADYEELSLSKWLLWRPTLRWAATCGIVVAVALGLATGETAFIYYQF